nr:PREDICTED: uncharacterized protein LOC105669015 [Linepithema humile]
MKFHRMIFGRKFILQTDHKPLLAIFGSRKGIPVYTANRLQRWALTLKAYDFKIEYVKTTDFGHADMLSRLIDNQHTENEDTVIATIQLKASVRQILHEAIDALPLTFNMVKYSTATDALLQSIARNTQNGWQEMQNADPEFSEYYKRKDALSIIDGCLM